MLRIVDFAKLVQQPPCATISLDTVAEFSPWLTIFFSEVDKKCNCFREKYHFNLYSLS